MVRPMLARGRGAIVNVASHAGMHGSPGQANNAASKAGLIALTQSLAAELAPKGIRVNAVVPGMIDTGRVSRKTTAEVRFVPPSAPIRLFSTPGATRRRRWTEHPSP